MKNKKLLWIIIILVVLALSGSAVYLLWSKPKKSETSLQTTLVTRRDIGSSVQATGTVKAMVGAEVKVGSRITGRVERLYASIGDRVKKGDIIVRLDQEDLKARVAKAKADLDLAEASLALIRSGSRKEEIQEAQEKIEQARSTLDLDKTILDREKTLLAKGYTTQETVDKAQKEYDVSLSQYKAAQEAIKLVKEKYIKEEIDAAVARVDQAKASLKDAEVQLSYGTIRAPLSGTIASVTTQQGETVTASLNAPTFITIIDLSRLEVDTYVDETDIGKVKVGQEATFTVASFPDKDFKGKVMAIYPKAVIQDNVVYYITIISADNPEGLLKPEMTATVNISLQKRENVLTVPNSAIRREGGKKVVFVLQNNQPIQREVKTGWKDSSYTEVLSGLNGGERVIIGETAGEKK
ncbi:MAG TPA: efflux RND transporter periplasmic adaptor subunit [Thermodesulfobacteriota bacterium]|nr:efflux RND transporter periplasmic adaptor subunit [Thermodesulfobacteriota bacterium]